jgi:cell division protein FtsI (penicillin-binding protein 3)
MYANNYRPVVNEKPVDKNLIPNVKGMGLKDALFLLENMNLKVQASGRGKVVSQSIEPGTWLKKNQTISLELN